jgi:glycerophosphoryl diester phosphodiesterase
MNYLMFSIMILSLSAACNSKEKLSPKPYIDVQGHRGCRGLMPENSLPAFQKALELKVNTLEMDLVVSQDEMVVVSHEPFFREGIAISPKGDTIGPDSHERYNMFKMPYSDIKRYVIGTVPDPNHPNRENIKTYKPLFRRVVLNTQDYAHSMEQEEPFYNIEIKRHPDYDGIFHPTVVRYVELVLAEVKELGIEEKVIIQSFDLETLRITKTQNPLLPIALLIENEQSAQENIEALGFKPAIYSCYHKSLTTEAVKYCHDKGVKVIPWTVNEQKDIDAMFALGVDGIISDYPDRVIATVR